MSLNNTFFINPIHMEALDVLRKLLSIRREEFLDADSLEKLQSKKLSFMAKRAAQTNQYEGLFQENGIKPSEAFDNLDSLPMTSKGSVRSNPDSFVPKGIRIDGLKTVHTSGSTGTPTRIYVDEEVIHSRHAIKYASEMSMGRSPLELFAHIFFHDFEANSFIARSGLFPKLFLSVSEPEEANFRKLLERRPKTLRGYPSVLSSLAKLNCGKLKFKSVISGGELLTENVRREIEDAFSAPVLNHYGCMESSTIARECPEERKLHACSFSNIVELVDEKGKAASSGRLVLTPLFNPVMPLLRYELGDYARWGKPCSCGRSTPVLESLEGRVDDKIVLPSGRTRPGMSIHPMVSSSSIYSYQIIQEAPERIVFRYVPHKGDGLPEKLRASVTRRILKGCLNEKVSVEFEEVNDIPRERTGKLRTIVCKVRNNSQ